MNETDEHTRRRFLMTGAAAATGLSLNWPELAAGQTLASTPECSHPGEVTLRQTEGPFFKPRSPQRADLREPGLQGRMVELGGFVLTRACKPVAGALVDLWHSDDKGEYDENGDRCRGHQFTDAGGRYRFVTILPALYTGRTRHFHLKVQAERGPVLTTQLYFPGEPQNARDHLFRRELLMRVSEAGGGLAARFDFVLDRS